MPSDRIKPSKNQIQHPPSPEVESVVDLAPPHLVPRILKFMLEGLNSKNLPTSPTINDDIITFWNYRLIKLGEKFKLNHFGPNYVLHPKNGHTFIVLSKNNWCVVAYCESDKKIILKIPAKSIRFLEEGHDSTEINFEVGDYCYIKSVYYRSPYERDKIFRIESIKNNYVTVDPGKITFIRVPDPLCGVDLTNNKKFELILTRGWKQKIPFSELEIIKHMPNVYEITNGLFNGTGPEWDELQKLCYQLGIY